MILGSTRQSIQANFRGLLLAEVSTSDANQEVRGAEWVRARSAVEVPLKLAIVSVGDGF